MRDPSNVVGRSLFNGADVQLLIEAVNLTHLVMCSPVTGDYLAALKLFSIVNADHESQIRYDLVCTSMPQYEVNHSRN